jgi:hypothetical protein
MGVRILERSLARAPGAPLVLKRVFKGRRAGTSAEWIAGMAGTTQAADSRIKALVGAYGPEEGPRVCKVTVVTPARPGTDEGHA